MKKIVLFLLVLICGANILLPGQIRITDSLKLALKNAKHDTTRCSILEELVENGLDNDKEIFNDQLYNLCEKNLKAISASNTSSQFYKNSLANSINNKGAFFQTKGDLPKALENYEKSLKLYKETGNKEGIAMSLHNTGYIFYNQGDIAKALDFYYKSLKIKEEIGDKKGIAFSYNILGFTFESQGDSKKGLEYYQKSLKIREEIGDKKGIGTSLNNIAEIYRVKGEITKALEYFYKSLKIKEEIGEKNAIAIALFNLGFILETLGDEVKSNEYFEKSLKLQLEVGDKQFIAHSFLRIGATKFYQGDVPKALDYYKKGLTMNEEIGNKSGIAYALNNMGLLYLNQGDADLATEHFEKCLKILEVLGDKEKISGTLTNIGSIYSDRGDLVNALSCHQKSLVLREEVGFKKGIANSLSNIGKVYLSQGDMQKALEYSTKSLKISEETGDKQSISNCLVGTGLVYLKKGEFTNGNLCFNRSFKIANDIHFIKEIKNAAKNLVIGYSAEKKVDSAAFFISTIYQINKKNLSNNYSTLSEKEKELFFTTLEKDYMLYYEFANLFHNNYPPLLDSSFNISIQNKGLTLKSSSAMRNAIIMSGDTILIKEYEEWKGLKNKITKLYESGKETKEFENKANELEKELVKKSNVFASFDKLKNIEWLQVQKALKKGEAAIEFVYYKSMLDTSNLTRYAALIVKPESIHPEIISLCNQKDLEKILEVSPGNNFASVNKVYGTKNESQTALYEKIWKPMEESLKGVKTVYYSPSGLLHKISFAAISNGKNSLLCNSYNLNRLGSTGQIAFPNTINYSADDEVMLMGGIQYNTDSTKKEVWKYLPGTLSETQEIERLLNGKRHKVQYYTSSNASEENFKKSVSRVKILHMATHGFSFPNPEVEREKIKKENEVKSLRLIKSNDVTKTETLTVKPNTTDIAFRGTTNYANWSFVNNKNPLMRSGLVLANANDVWNRNTEAKGEDGILTASEVSNLDMRNTKLVVLSACETGLGDIKGSEGVYGLQRAFKMAGVNYIIMSLWQVPDKETSEFMTTFYNNLTKEKDIKIAFNKTQKKFSKKYDPYFWAAFTLVE